MWHLAARPLIRPLQFSQSSKTALLLSFLPIATRTCTAGSPAAKVSPQKLAIESFVCDQWTPHVGTIIDITSKGGAVVDIGSKVPGVLHAKGFYAIEASIFDSLRVWDQVTVFFRARQPCSDHVVLSLDPGLTPCIPWGELVADGQHPYPGKISSKAAFGLFVDIGSEMPALLPTQALVETKTKLKIGDDVVVYIVSKRGDTRRLSAELVQRDSPLQSMEELPVDGVTPLCGVVRSVRPDLGAFIDVGVERLGLLPNSELEPNSDSLPDVGSPITVYASQRLKHGKIEFSLTPRKVALHSFDSVVVDGQTPYSGVVERCGAFGALVNIGCDTPGLLPSRTETDQATLSTLEAGSHVVVYVVSKLRDSGKIIVSLERRSSAVETLADIVCDGQTPYEGYVSLLSEGGVFVEIGYERPGFLEYRASDAQLPDETKQLLEGLSIGDPLTVYVIQKRADSGKIDLALQPRERPLLRLEELLADGQTPYEGVVARVKHFGALIDIGAERLALLTDLWHPKDMEGQRNLAEGQRLQVFVFRRNPLGKLTVSLVPSATPRLTIAEVEDGDSSVVCKGFVYKLKHGKLYVDFGCEAGGVIAVAESGANWSTNEEINVRIVSYLPEAGRFSLSLVGKRQ